MAFSFFKRKDKDNSADNVVFLPVSAIVPNQFQPRQVFDKTAIIELAKTIETHGLLQPIVVRKLAQNDNQASPKYELIAGERRFRAVTYLRWEKIAALIRDFDDTQAASFAVIENLQRQDLSAIEEARAYMRLMKLNQLTQTQLARELGKSQAFVANKLRLLKLADAVQRALLARKITERHGRCLVALSAEQQVKILNQIERNHLTVAQTEAIVKKMTQPKKPARKKKQTKGAAGNVQVVYNTLQKSLDLIEQSGVKLETKKEHHNGFERLIIDIPTKTSADKKEAK